MNNTIRQPGLRFRRTSVNRDRMIAGRNRRVRVPESPQMQEAIDKYESSRNVRSDLVYGNPILHWSTRNASFLEVHKQLKILGIENNAFFLVLLNPALEYVDPYDPDITPEEAMMVVEECYHNFFYYLREVVRIPEQGGTCVMFRLDRGTLAAAWCFYNNINYYLMKPRQTGKSVANCVFLSWAFKFGTTNSQFMFSANTDKNVKELLRKMKNYIYLLPSYLSKMGSTKRNAVTGKMDRRTDNVKTYAEPRNGNSAFCARRGNTPDVAEEIGRGDSHGYEFFDEAEFTPYLDIIVKVSGMAFNTASENIRKNGGHCCRIFSSTPGDLGDEKRGKRVMAIVNDCLPWDEHFYDIGPEVVQERLKAKSNFQIIYIEYSYQDLGYGEKWFLDACSNVGYDTAKIRREILLQRFTGNSRSPFTPEEITELKELERQPLWTDKIDVLNELKFYVKREEIKKNRVYFIGCDPSEGTGGDHYAICAIDPYTMETVMEFQNSFMTPTGFIELLEYLVQTYFNRPIISIERNRNGGTLIHFVSLSPILKRFLYHTPEATSDQNLYKEKLDDKGFVEDKISRTKYYGINTLTNTRSVMMKILVDAMHFSKEALSTAGIVQDVVNLVEIRGKIQADNGKHDDLIMAWCIAMYTLYYGERLELYGFRKGELPADVLEDDEFKKLEQLYNNPYIRQQFPSAYAYYINEVREKKKQESAKQKQRVRRREIKSGIGSIKTSLEKKKIENQQIEAQTLRKEDPEAWKQQLTSRWRSLNK